MEAFHVRDLARIILVFCRGTEGIYALDNNDDDD